VNKNIIFLSSSAIFGGNNASSSRVLNYARAICGNENTRVFIASSEFVLSGSNFLVHELERNIFTISSQKKRNRYLELLIKPFFNTFFALSYCKNLFKIVDRYNGKKIFFFYPSFEVSYDLCSVLYFKFLKRCKVFCELNELKKTNISILATPKNPLKALFSAIRNKFNYSKLWLNEYTLSFFSGVISISTSLETYAKRKNRNVIRIPVLTSIDSKPHKPLQFVFGENFRMCLAGQINLKKEGLLTLFQALGIVVKVYPNFSLTLYGSINDAEKDLILKHYPTQYGVLNNVVYGGIFDQSSNVEIFRNSHLLLLPRDFHPQTKYGFSTKLAEYLASGVPVLVTNVSDNGLYIHDTQNGFIVKAGNFAEMAEKILFIIHNYGAIAPFVSMNAQELVNKHFYYKNYSNLLDTFLD
jgi:glycosyltransferase involved in cell wall biosynthesis